MKSGDTAAPPNVNYDSINMGSSAQLNTTESVIVNNGRSDSQTSEGPLMPRLRSESRDSIISVGMSAGRRRSLRNNQSGQIVRENINQELQASRRASRSFYLITMFVVWSQVLAAAIVLPLNWNAPCDAPLNVWCTIYAARLLIVGSVRTYAYYAGISEYDRTLESEVIERIKSVLELFGLLWFVLGNYWTFKTDDCVGTPLFNLSISYVILGYIYLLLPLFVCMCVIMCLPCVIILMRYMKPNQGVNDETIQKHTQVMNFTNQYSTEDAQCAICLSDYEANEELRALPCSHHFHKACVDQWLKINQACPLCKQNIDGSTNPPRPASPSSLASEAV